MRTTILLALIGATSAKIITPTTPSAAQKECEKVDNAKCLEATCFSNKYRNTLDPTIYLGCSTAGQAANRDNWSQARHIAVCTQNETDQSCKKLLSKNKRLEATALKTKTAAEKAFEAKPDNATKDVKDAADANYAFIKKWVSNDNKAFTNSWNNDGSQPYFKFWWQSSILNAPLLSDAQTIQKTQEIEYTIAQKANTKAIALVTSTKKTYDGKVAATATAKKNEAKSVADKKIWTDAVTAETDAKTKWDNAVTAQKVTGDKETEMHHWNVWAKDTIQNDWNGEQSWQLTWFKNKCIATKTKADMEKIQAEYELILTNAKKACLDANSSKGHCDYMDLKIQNIKYWTQWGKAYLANTYQPHQITWMVNKIASQDTLEDAIAIQKVNVKTCDAIKVSLAKVQIENNQFIYPLSAELTQCTAWDTQGQALIDLRTPADQNKAHANSLKAYTSAEAASAIHTTDVASQTKECKGDLKTSAKCKQITIWVAQDEAHMKAFKNPSVAFLKTNYDSAAAKVAAAMKAQKKADCNGWVTTKDCKHLADELSSVKKEAAAAKLLCVNKQFTDNLIIGLSATAFVIIGVGSACYIKAKCDDKKKNKSDGNMQDDSYIAFVDVEK